MIARRELERTVKEKPCLCDDFLDVDGGLFCFGGDIAAGRGDDERVCLAVRVLQIEPAEEDGRGRDDPLPELEFLAELRDHCGRGVSGCDSEQWTRGHGRFAKNMLRSPRLSGLPT